MSRYGSAFTSSSPPAVKSYKAVPNCGVSGEGCSSSRERKLFEPGQANGFKNSSLSKACDTYDGVSSLIWKWRKYILNSVTTNYTETLLKEFKKLYGKN